MSTINASCHCGAVELELPEAPTTLNDCNCSICRRLGTLWAYYNPKNVKLIHEPGATIVYLWGDKMLEFHTCKTCGCTAYWAGVDKSVERMGVNARLMDPSVINGVRVRHSDGADTWTDLAWSVFPFHTGIKKSASE
jgi:hypothetical protein